jgi:Na+-transporting NADH:ubiquinone oxidoreductase subunit NqrC
MRNPLAVRLALAFSLICAILVSIVGNVFTTRAQDQRSTDQDKVVINKDEVALDVVVRDKKEAN